ncbi:hypothetical protein QTP88_026169 [Uroleucon formosanum]
MSANLTTRLDELQSRGVSPSPAVAYYGTEHRGHVETSVALSEIRTQLHELTRSLESCQSEVTEVKRDMVAIKNELDTVQQVKEEIEELREYVDRLELQSHRRKLRLLEQGLTFFLSYTILASMLGMLQFGYNTGVINAPEGNIEKFIKDVFEDRYKENMDQGQAELLYSFAVSIFAIGGMLGGFSGGIIANHFGRSYFNSYEVLFIGRFIIGVNCGMKNIIKYLLYMVYYYNKNTIICFNYYYTFSHSGLNTSLVPMYISEILAVTTGLLISQILGIEQILGTDEGWPLLLGLAICPAILQLILLPVCPESPRYLLITKQWEEEARKALRRLRATNQIEEDIEEMRAEERAQQSEATISMMELVCSPTLRQPLIISVVMQLSQQLSGINAVFYYSTNLFIIAGLPEKVAKFATIGIGIIMVNMTLVTMPLMDKTGRRTLHLYGLGGMFIFSIFITISFLIKEMIDWMSYLAVVSILGFVVFFAVGPGSIPWMITAELFSQGPRPAAMSIAVLINWVANFAVGIGFQPLKTALDNYTFLPFSVLLAIFWIFTYKKVPETKNKTFEEILALFRQNGSLVEIEASKTTSTITSVRPEDTPLDTDKNASYTPNIQ